MSTSRTLIPGLVLMALSRLGTGLGTAGAMEPPQVAIDAPAQLDNDFNGITTDAPKIYNDRLLEQMLLQFESQLAQLKAFDNPTLTSRIGTLQGATSQQSSFAAQATARPTPDVTSTVATGDKPGTTTVTKNASVAPAAPAITDSGAVALPTSFSTSASSALAEEAQLAFEIANLRLLLQESLSDRFNAGSNNPKRSVTIGIPISIEVSADSKNAVAEVEVFITSAGPSSRVMSCSPADQGTPANSCRQISAPDGASASPGVIALLPREKTYNVAAIKDSSVSLGAGAVVANVINLGINWLGRKQSYYIVQAVDTVAMQRATQQPATTVLAWQFRPVLGEKTVKPGLRQVFARLSFSPSGVSPDIGTVWVRTTWRRYNHKTGAVGEPKSVKVWTRCFPLVDTGRFAQATEITWSDLGNGSVSVVASGVFPPGTSVLLPEGFLADGSPGFLLDPKRLIFNLAAQQLVRDSIGSLVSINANKCELKIVCHEKSSAKIKEVTVAPFNAAQSKVTVELEDGDQTNSLREPPLVLLGQHVFGLRDAPFFEVDALPSDHSEVKQWRKLSFLVPKDDLRQARGLALAHPFCGKDFYDTHAIGLQDDFVAAQASTLSAGDGGSDIAISGQGLTEVSVLVGGIPAGPAARRMASRPALPSGQGGLARSARTRRHTAPPIATAAAPCEPPTVDALAPTMLLLHVPSCRATGLKSIVVASRRGETVVLTLDPGETKPQVKQPDPLPQLAAGTKRMLKLTGANLGLIQDVQYNGVTLQPTIAGDKSFISIVLPDEINNKAGFYLLTAIASDKAKTQVPVVITIAAPPKPPG